MRRVQDAQQVSIIGRNGEALLIDVSTTDIKRKARTGHHLRVDDLRL
jgi:hypothetical protein